jgi:hypothetical protein
MAQTHQDLPAETDLDAITTSLRGFYIWTLYADLRYWKWIARGNGEDRPFTVADLYALLQGIYGKDEPVSLRHRPDLHPRILVDQDGHKFVGSWRDATRPGHKRTLTKINQAPNYLSASNYLSAQELKGTYDTRYIYDALDVAAISPDLGAEPIVISDQDLDLDS